MVRGQAFVGNLHIDAVGYHVSEIPIAVVIEIDVSFKKLSAGILMLIYCTHIGP